MKKGHVCLFFMIVILTFCAFSFSDQGFSADVICPVTGNSFRIIGYECGPVKDFPAYCPYCEIEHYFDVTLSHQWSIASSEAPTTEKEGYINYLCDFCGATATEILPVLPPEPTDPDLIVYMNWLSSVLGLFSMTLNSIMSFRALQMFVGVLVFLIMFSLLAKLLQQGRRGRL